MEQEHSDRDRWRITMNHFELKKQSDGDENFRNDLEEARDEMTVSHLSGLDDECLVELENSRVKSREEPEKNSSSERTRCGSCLLFFVKCLDLLININIIGLNFLNFKIRNI